MSNLRGLKIKTTTWSEIKEKYGYTDNNDNCEFGFEFVPDENGLRLMDELLWFTSEAEMHTYINQNELKVLDVCEV